MISHCAWTRLRCVAAFNPSIFRALEFGPRRPATDTIGWSAVTGHRFGGLADRRPGRSAFSGSDIIPQFVSPPATRAEARSKVELQLQTPYPLLPFAESRRVPLRRIMYRLARRCGTGLLCSGLFIVHATFGAQTPGSLDGTFDSQDVLVALR